MHNNGFDFWRQQTEPKMRFMILGLASCLLLVPLSASAAPPTPLALYDFNESGNAPGNSGTDRRPLKMRNDAGTALDFHSADEDGVSGLPGDRAFDNSGANDHGSVASIATNGFRAEQSDNPALDGLAEFTISGWFKTETISSLQGKTPRLVNNHDGGSGLLGDGFNLQFLNDTDGDLKLEVDDDTGGGVNTIGTPYAAKQTWVFFAVSYDGNTATDNVNFYVGFRDEAEAGGGPGSEQVTLVGTESLNRGAVDSESVGLHVGNRPQNNRPFDGFLDEIRIDAAILSDMTLEEIRLEGLEAPPAVDGLTWVDTATVATSAQDQNSATVTVNELSGVMYDPGSGNFWAVADGGGRLLEIDVTFDCDGNMTSASAVSAITLVDNFDFEGIARIDAGNVLLSEEGAPQVGQYALADGSFVGGVPIGAVFSNDRGNLSLESLTRTTDGARTITGVEQALTVDGPAGSSTTVSTVSRWQLFDASLDLDGQVAYLLEPAHDSSVGLGSSLSEISFMPDDTLLSLERSDASGEFLVRIFEVDLSAATDVSQAPFDDGLDPGETYVAPGKTLLLSDDGFGKLEGLAAGPEMCGVQMVLGVEDAGGANVIHSFTRPVPEPGFVLQVALGVLGLAGWRRLRG